MKYSWIQGAILILISIIVPVLLFLPGQEAASQSPWETIKTKRSHLDHASFFTKEFTDARDVTKTCLKCHPDAARDLMKTAHWKWERTTNFPGHGTIKIGKKNLVNNFCIGIQGNEASCTSCHAGYGWSNKNFDFNKQENVDCLICHDWSGSYVKGKAGFPAKNVNLRKVAQSVGYPKRENCGICHIYGGGGMGVKHGDLDQTLVNPSPGVDIHMGKYNLLCIDCHRTEKHNIKGKSYSVSVNHENGIACVDCHVNVPHRDRRINLHLKSVACQTCHIPVFAKKAPTKTAWDWSKAGIKGRAEDIKKYLKKKGEFVYQKEVIPEYYWFNMTTSRYMLGDKINTTGVTHLNYPNGSIKDSKAKIWPYKVHRATQPYDTVYNYILQPVTSGKGGYWHTYDWHSALQKGAKLTGMKYSGSFGFVKTDMHWPLSHMVSPSHKALTCCDCHGENSRINWKALGYTNDPLYTGSRELPVDSTKKE